MFKFKKDKIGATWMGALNPKGFINVIKKIAAPAMAAITAAAAAITAITPAEVPPAETASVPDAIQIVPLLAALPLP
ncbi:uncharacterized protein PHALS_02901 [Plasmopara halstedii]|uniref:Uncharacterized protein n=1 Tax=Plasmopara halstedii TaxID=4781 RepID=A0A0P1AXE8_PLAHL|nr:uncharacterized protein PHALS_02901 [Plasmopara halstedii]CEG46501.1 hypothetical protein PHALS_02901 [Plasmopara halstedii]|eukprot:XP_024582870.1 hypothetical protein PHALS_02901 [Plasmopara halstedii]